MFLWREKSTVLLANAPNVGMNARSKPPGFQRRTSMRGHSARHRASHQDRAESSLRGGLCRFIDAEADRGLQSSDFYSEWETEVIFLRLHNAGSCSCCCISERKRVSYIASEPGFVSKEVCARKSDTSAASLRATANTSRHDTEFREILNTALYSKGLLLRGSGFYSAWSNESNATNSGRVWSLCGHTAERHRRS